ncbi:MAG: hypothetical protein Q4A62_07565 [Eikenella sp.]|nr:hypothetical protein [Eikenella sp.]
MACMVFIVGSCRIGNGYGETSRRQKYPFANSFSGNLRAADVQRLPEFLRKAGKMGSASVGRIRLSGKTVAVAGTIAFATHLSRAGFKHPIGGCGDLFAGSPEPLQPHLRRISALYAARLPIV